MIRPDRAPTPWSGGNLMIIDSVSTADPGRSTEGAAVASQHLGIRGRK